MKYLGIDYGTKKIGISVSNDDGTVAFPKKVLENSPTWLDEIYKLCEEEKITGGIVFGESRDFSMEENPLMKEIHEAREKWSEKSPLPTFLHPEFMTSRQANRIAEEDDMHDARAAALILQGFFDKK